MKKTLLSIAVVGLSGGYIIYQYLGSGSVQATNTGILGTSAPPSSVSSTASGSGSGSSPQSTQSSSPSPVSTKPTGQYVDGTYTGSSADAYYGPVQVQATITNGQLANVTILQYPNSHGTSVYINQQAMPYLTQEAIQSQSSNVNVISGATYTSMAFEQSLSDALSKAKA